MREPKIPIDNNIIGMIVNTIMNFSNFLLENEIKFFGTPLNFIVKIMMKNYGQK